MLGDLKCQQSAESIANPTVELNEQNYSNSDLKKMQTKKETRKKPFNVGNQVLQQQILQQIYGSKASHKQAAKQLTGGNIHFNYEMKAKNTPWISSKVSRKKKRSHSKLPKENQQQPEVPLKLLSKISIQNGSLTSIATTNSAKTHTSTDTSIKFASGSESSSPDKPLPDFNLFINEVQQMLAVKSKAAQSAQDVCYTALNANSQKCQAVLTPSITNTSSSASLNPSLLCPSSNNKSRQLRPSTTTITTTSLPSKRKSFQLATQETELMALQKYINQIVGDYLAKLGTQYVGFIDRKTNMNLKFYGGLNNLGIYADRLVRAGLGFIVEEKIRVYRKNNQLAFLTLSEGKRELCDAVITLRAARHYAFDGDVVRAFVLHSKEQEQPEKNGDTLSALIEDSINEDPLTAAQIPKQCPKAFVISIVKQPKPRLVVGVLCLQNTRIMHGVRYYVLRPEDYRLPLLYVPQLWSPSFNNVARYYFLVEVVEVTASGHCIGSLVKCLGMVGHIQAEIKAILATNNLHHIKPYEAHFNKMYAEEEHVSGAELQQCMDLRDLCVFSIDPPNAHDIDDALSLELVNGQRIVVGVHIADVSKYLKEDTALDMQVRQRATSIYIGNEVIHMLPEGLCRKCSLYAGKERFVLSVFLVFDMSGKLIDLPKFMRSIIKSCAQLTYEQAQQFIDQSKAVSLPEIKGKHTLEHIKGRVKLLHRIAQAVRKQRYADGALSIHNPKLQFELDRSTGEPVQFQLEQRQEANFLIEEFMLLANQAVAKLIHAQFPQNAILRAHSPPLQRPLQAVRERLAKRGLHLDCSSAGSIYASIQRICEYSRDPEAMMACLSNWLTKPMVRAVYLCSDGKSLDDLQHYALSIPIYTHFTSPIRRYADIMVHRLVAAALDLAPPPRRQPAELQKLAELCNEQKYNAKCAAEDTANFLFKRYIQLKEKLSMAAVVVELLQRSLSVLLIETGHIVSVFFDQQRQVRVDKTGLPHFVQMSGGCNSKTYKLEVFTKLHVEVKVCDNKLQGFLKPPTNLVRSEVGKNSSSSSNCAICKSQSQRGLCTAAT